VKYRLTAHALTQMQRRGLDRVTVQKVLDAPGQAVEERSGRRALQSRVNFPGGEYLVRVIVDLATEPPSVVTVYRTRHVAKYWRKP